MCTPLHLRSTTLAVPLGHSYGEIPQRGPVKKTTQNWLTMRNKLRDKVRKLYHDDMAQNQKFSAAEITVFSIV